MKYKGIRNMITKDVWNKMNASKRLEGSVIDVDDVGLTLGCDFIDYYQLPIIYISEVIKEQYPFIKKEGS